MAAYPWIVLLENWLAERPVLVNGNSEILVGHCRRSHGGLWYNNYSEWCGILSRVDRKSKRHLGLHGKRYVEKKYSWDRVEKDYEAALESALNSAARTFPVTAA